MSLLTTAVDRNVAKGAQLRELLGAVEARRDSRYVPDTLFSMTPPDFSECKNANWDKVQPQLQQTLFVVFLNDQDWRRTISARQQLDKRLSSSGVAGLTACLQASFLAAWCEEQVWQLTDNAPPSSSQLASPSTRKNAYCSAINALSKEVRP